MAGVAAQFARLVPQAVAATRAQLAEVEKKRQKAGVTAVKVEGFRLHKLLKKQVSAGAVDGATWEPLSMIARKFSKSTKAGRKLAKAIRYEAKQSGGTFGMVVGFIHGPGKMSSKSWVRIATVFQSGERRAPGKAERRGLAGWGASMTERSKYRKYFFIRKETIDFTTKPRPIIEPFWTAHKNDALKNIQDNYRRKMAGERI